MDYLQIKQMIAGIDSASAAQQLAQQNPTIDPNLLLPHLTSGYENSPASFEGAKGPPGAPPDWTKALTGAQGMLTPTPQQPAPRANLFAYGSQNLAKPKVVLPGGPQNTGTSFGQFMGARKNAY